MRFPTWVFNETENQLLPILKQCTNFKALKKIHAHILVSSLSQSTYLATQIINVCNSCREIDYATSIFNQFTHPNIFLYNALVKSYTQNHHFVGSIKLYKQMLRCPQARIDLFADRFTYPFVIKACSGSLSVDLGRQVHTHVLKSGLESNYIIQNSLLEMYAKCDDLVFAHKLFDEMSERDVVAYNILLSAFANLGQMRKARAVFNTMPNRTVISWTTLICGYTLAGQNAEAIEAFQQMQMEGIEPDEISITSILPACAHLGALELGKWIHAYSDKHRLTSKIFVCNALIEMYSKCGSIGQARQIFDEMLERDVITWSSIIGGLANHGRAREAIGLFVAMENEKEVRPNKITFIGVLTACAHGGLLDEGMYYFNSMKNIYGIEPEVEHYGCLIDLLGRSGNIGKALEIIDIMPVPADAAIWGSLLSASKIHGDTTTAVKSMGHLVELEPEESGNYVLLANVHASARNWEGVAKMRKVMRSRRLRRTPGCSSIVVNNLVQEFVAGDCKNWRFGEISGMLDLLLGLTDRESEERVKKPMDLSSDYSDDYLLAEECC